MLFRVAGQEGLFPGPVDRGAAGRPGRQHLSDQIVRREQRAVVRRQDRDRRHQDRRDRGAHRCTRPPGALRQRSSRRALRLGARRAQGRGGAGQARRPRRVHRHQRHRPQGHPQHAGRRCRARGRGPCPACRADDRARIPRPARLRRRGGVPLPGGHRRALRLPAAAAVGRTDDDRRGGLHRHRPDRAVARLLGIRPAVRSGLSAGHAGRDLCERHGARLHAHRARALGDPRRLRPLSVARSGGADRAPSRIAAARRRAARDHRDVHRRARLHAHIRAVRSARPDPVHEPLPHADDRPDPQPPRHDRQVHGRCDHGVLECAARRRSPRRAAPAIRRSPCRRAWSS